MTALLVFMLFALVSIIVLFVVYTATTNSIIRTQERQIQRLTEDNTRLKQANRKLKEDNSKIKEALDKANNTKVVNIYTEGYQKSLKESTKGLKFGD